MKKIVVFASGSGSNFQTIVDKLHQKTCEVALLVCDKAGAYCLERAENYTFRHSFLIQKSMKQKQISKKKSAND